MAPYSWAETCSCEISFNNNCCIESCVRLYIIYLYVTVNEGFRHRAIITCLKRWNKIAGTTRLGGCYGMMADITAHEFLYTGKGKLSPQCEKWLSCDEDYVEKYGCGIVGHSWTKIFPTGVEKTRSKYAYFKVIFWLFLLHLWAKGTAP
jgi:hypothetical protein